MGFVHAPNITSNGGRLCGRLALKRADCCRPVPQFHHTSCNPCARSSHHRVWCCAPQPSSDKGLPTPSSPPPTDTAPKSALVRLVLHQFPLLPGMHGGVRVGYLSACIASVAAGHPLVGVTGVCFLFVAAMTESPATLASLAALMVAGILDLGVSRLFDVPTAWVPLLWSYGTFTGLVALVAVVDDDVELGLDSTVSVDAAVSRFDERKARDDILAENVKREEIQRVLWLEETTNQMRQDEAQDLKSWDGRFSAGTNEEKSQIDRDSL